MRLSMGRALVGLKRGLQFFGQEGLGADNNEVVICSYAFGNKPAYISGTLQVDRQSSKRVATAVQDINPGRSLGSHNRSLGNHHSCDRLSGKLQIASDRVSRRKLQLIGLEQENKTMTESLWVDVRSLSKILRFGNA